MKIVLVRTEGDENIGSAARAMMNMGEKDLVLVNPGCDHLSKSALAYSVHAGQVLRSAEIYDDLSMAVEGSSITAAISRRDGQWRKRDFILDEFADFLMDYDKKRVSLVFGNEKTGLTNEELQVCDVICSIPSSAEFPSLNLAHAVMVTLYEINRTGSHGFDRQASNIAPRLSFDGMLDEIRTALSELGFFKSVPDWRLTNYIRKILVRAKLDEYDVMVIKNLFKRLKGMVKKLKS